MKSKSIYIGDIDPNNKIDSTLSIRRQIVFNLLIWDSIILSDSQCLTDPRIRMLMKGNDSANECMLYGVEEIDDSLKGIECLIEAGLIEIAHRDTQEKSFEMLWKDMRKKDTKDVPYLPKTMRYATYLDTIPQQCQIYSLSSIGGRFRDNLNVGIENGDFILNQSNSYEMELRRMFLEKRVLFRDLLDFLRSMAKKGIITQERYYQIYSYIYGNYSTNISAEVGCNMSTLFKNIPLHLELGEGDSSLESGWLDCQKLRTTWSFDPRVLDLISFEELVNIRRVLTPVFENGVLIDFYKGELLSENKLELIDVWAEFTEKLETILKYSLDKATLNQLLITSSANKPIMDFVSNSGISLMTGILGMVFPWVGTVTGLANITKDAVDSGMSIYHFLKRKKTDSSTKKQKEILLHYVNPDTKIITKIDK